MEQSTKKNYFGALKDRLESGLGKVYQKYGRKKTEKFFEVFPKPEVSNGYNSQEHGDSPEDGMKYFADNIDAIFDEYKAKEPELKKKGRFKRGLLSFVPGTGYTNIDNCVQSEVVYGLKKVKDAYDKKNKDINAASSADSSDDNGSLEKIALTSEEFSDVVGHSMSKRASAIIKTIGLESDYVDTKEGATISDFVETNESKAFGISLYHKGNKDRGLKGALKKTYEALGNAKNYTVSQEISKAALDTVIVASGVGVAAKAGALAGAASVAGKKGLIAASSAITGIAGSNTAANVGGHAGAAAVLEGAGQTLLETAGLGGLMLARPVWHYAIKGAKDKANKYRAEGKDKKADAIEIGLGLGSLAIPVASLAGCAGGEDNAEITKPVPDNATDSTDQSNVVPSNPGQPNVVPGDDGNPQIIVAPPQDVDLRPGGDSNGDQYDPKTKIMFIDDKVANGFNHGLQWDTRDGEELGKIYQTSRADLADKLLQESGEDTKIQHVVAWDKNHDGKFGNDEIYVQDFEKGKIAEIDVGKGFTTKSIMKDIDGDGVKENVNKVFTGLRTVDADADNGDKTVKYFASWSNDDAVKIANTLDTPALNIEQVAHASLGEALNSRHTAYFDVSREELGNGNVFRATPTKYFTNTSLDGHIDTMSEFVQSANAINDLSAIPADDYASNAFEESIANHPQLLNETLGNMGLDKNEANITIAKNYLRNEAHRLELEGQSLFKGSLETGNGPTMFDKAAVLASKISKGVQMPGEDLQVASVAVENNPSSDYVQRIFGDASKVDFLKNSVFKRAA